MEQKIKNIIHGHPFKELVGFALMHEAEIGEIRNEQDFVDWLINSTSAGTKGDFLDHFYYDERRWGDSGLRICSTCGKFMDEGYILGGNMYYACSRECALKLYGDIAEEVAEERLDKALLENEEDYYWTGWEQVL